MPPESSVRYAVRFFYFDGTRDKYWSQSADRVDDVWMPFYKPRPAIVAAVKGLIQPTDTDEQKLRKIYAAVQHLVNTDYSRQRTRDEDRQAGFRDPQNSEDIWKSKRGDSQQLAFLVIALARAAGVHR